MPYSWYARQESFQHGKSMMSSLCCKWNILIKQGETASTFFKQSITPVRNTYSYLFLCKFWMSTKIIRLELSEKTFTLPRHGDIILNYKEKTQTREKYGSLDFSLVWRCYDILCFHFYFVFRTDGKTDHLG